MTEYQYAGGEEPRAGDTIRAHRTDFNRRTSWTIGDVFVTTAPWGLPRFTDKDGDSRGGRAVRAFELIARAGEPIRYQPGDVIEVLPTASFYKHFRGQYTVTEPSGPGRNGVSATTLNGTGLFWEHEIKLVHRPAPAKEPLAFTPPEPQVGDRVRVTFEGKFRNVSADGGASIVVDGGVFGTPFSAKELAAAKIELIERAEKPLAVGDRVEHVNGATPRSSDYRVRLIEKDELVLQSSGPLCVVPRADWRRVR